ncbi:MAG TPA: helix-turn-helix domain-containing protein [Nitrososphaera sp.]|nr:helix-turn-helix domain-containing protein [Nitrososphaera sp.]
MDELKVSNPYSEVENGLIAELQKLDLTLNEARILLFLMTHGNSTASDVSRHTGIQRTETYNYISTLLSKGVVFSTFDRPQKYYALPIQEVIDCLVQTKQNALQQIAEKKKGYQQMIDSIVSNTVIQDSDKKESYQIVMGENSINSKIKRMLEEAKEDVTILVTDRNLVNFYHAEITDKMIQLTSKGIRVKLRTPCKNATDYITAENEDGGKKATTPISLKTTAKVVPVNFVLVDNKDIILLLESNSYKKSELCGFYTNNLSMISVFRFIFDNLI